MIRLQLILDESPLGRYEFEPGSDVTIGRQPGSDLRIDDVGVSRAHCKLSFQAGRGWMVEDLGSSNGTHLNRRRLSAPQLLHDDDVITVGKFSLVVTTGSRRSKEGETIGWKVSPESMERSATRTAHLAPAREGDPPVLIQQDALKIGAAARCDLRLPGAPPLLALLVRGYGGFQLINVLEDSAAVRVNEAPLVDRRWLRDEDRLEFGSVAYAFHAGFPADAFGTVQMDVADLNLGSLDAPYGGE